MSLSACESRWKKILFCVLRLHCVGASGWQYPVSTLTMRHCLDGKACPLPSSVLLVCLVRGAQFVLPVCLWLLYCGTLHMCYFLCAFPVTLFLAPDNSLPNCLFPPHLTPPTLLPFPRHLIPTPSLLTSPPPLFPPHLTPTPSLSSSPHPDSSSLLASPPLLPFPPHLIHIPLLSSLSSAPTPLPFLHRRSTRRQRGSSLHVLQQKSQRRQR